MERTEEFEKPRPFDEWVGLVEGAERGEHEDVHDKHRGLVRSLRPRGERRVKREAPEPDGHEGGVHPCGHVR